MRARPEVGESGALCAPQGEKDTMKFQFSALAIVMTLAACGGDSPPPVAPAPVESAAPSAAPSAAVAAPVETTVAKVEEHTPEHHEAPPAPKTLLDVAASNTEFSMFVNAVKEAGLEEELKGKGPYTLFAPTDEAFKKLKKGEFEALLKNKKNLTKLLNGHLVDGKMSAAEVGKSKSLKTVAGGKLAFKVAKDGTVSVGKGKVTTPDLQAENGVIHMVDTVLK